MKILIMGLSGSGKTYLAERLSQALNAAHFNADQVRQMASDWDFTPHGRKRQAERMRNLADFEVSKGRLAVCDFICPTKEMREIFSADFVVWMDTVEASKYMDTDAIFEKPNSVDVRLRHWREDSHKVIAQCVWSKLGA